MTVYHYRAFNLRIASQIELPELQPIEAATGAPDILIQLGAVPDVLPNPSATSQFFQRNRQQFRLQIPNIAAFWVENGRTIIVAAQTDDLDLVRALLLDTVMVALLYQRDVCLLQGSCIQTPDGAVVLANKRGGNGCSTLAAALSQRGYAVIADLFVPVDVQASVPQVLPAYPFQHLWHNSLKLLGFAPDAYRPVRADLQKYVVPLGERFGSAAPVRRIYILQAHQRTLEIAPVSGLNKLKALEGLLYHGPFQEANQARALVALGRDAQIFSLNFRLTGDLGALVESFEAHLTP